MKFHPVAERNKPGVRLMGYLGLMFTTFFGILSWGTWFMILPIFSGVISIAALVMTRRTIHSDDVEIISAETPKKGPK